MIDKKIGVRLIVIILLGTILATACTQSYSSAPAATPTLIPAGLFVSPLPTGVDAMQLVADFGTQTAVAMTANANATAGTPLAPTIQVTATPTLQSGTFITPLSGSVTPAPVTVVPMTGTVSAAPVPGGIPATYTLQQGEFVYCIARRYNLDPEELLRLNNLHDWDAQYLSPGLPLQLPQTGNPFPGIRAWHNHPDTYTVSGNNDTTLFGVACFYGDIDPATIAQANNLPLYTNLTIGQQLTIP